jgi:SPP1 family predicted phage head-tail adaptor
MRADYRHLINIKQRTAATNSYGELLGWTTAFSDVFAAKEPLLGNEYYKAETTGSKVEVKFRCHYFDGITNEMRIECDGIEYEILSAINVKSLNREWLIYAKKVV